MDKLFRFSKLTAIITLASAVLFAVFSLIQIFTIHSYADPLVSVIYGSILSVPMILKFIEIATIAVFFGLIYKFSVNGSPLRKPAVIGIISAVIGCVSIILANTLSILILISSILYVIGFSISFIWLSIYFNEKKIKQLCIVYAVFHLLVQILSFEFIYYHFWYLGEGGMYSYFIIHTLLVTSRMIILSVFYHMFYKMSTK